MKIFIVSNLYYPNVFGGAERCAQNVAESLMAQGHETVVAALNPKGRYETADVNGVRVHYLPNRNIYFFGLPKRRSAPAKLLWHGLDTYNPLVAASLGRILDAERPDVVNTQNLAGFSVSAWRAVKRRELPLVHTLHDLNLLCPRGMLCHGKLCQTPCIACRAYGWPRRELSNLVDVVTGVSKSILDKSCRYGCFHKAEKMVVYNAVEPALDNAARANGRNGALQFGFIGRLHPSKGVDVLIRSFLELPDGKAKLLIAGRGTPEYEDKLQKLINGKPSVQMLGFVAASDFLRAVDVLVVPSLWPEPAAGVILESMANRVPVIGSCRGGTPELMGAGTGWVFDPDVPEELTGTLQLAIESRSEFAAMGVRASERIRQFSTAAMVNGYLKAYSSAIDKNNRNTQRS